MKKITLALMAAALCVCLLACGKSRAARQVDEMIAAIGTVTLDSAEQIQEAAAAAQALPYEDWEQLEHLELLRQAQVQYDILVEQQVPIDAVEEVIASIGPVTLDSGAAIDAAWQAYLALDDELKPRVSNFKDLTDARADFFLAQIQDVESAIDAIGQVTLDSWERIVNARAVYESYDPSIRDAIINLDVLTAAEKAYSDLRRAYAVSLIRVTDIWFSKPDTAGGVELYFNFQNVSHRVISQLTFGVTFYDADGRIAMCRYDRAEINLNTYPGPFEAGEGLEGTDWFWGDYYNPDIASVELTYLKIEYEDGETVILNRDELVNVWY